MAMFPRRSMEPSDENQKNEGTPPDSFASIPPPSSPPEGGLSNVPPPSMVPGTGKIPPFKIPSSQTPLAPKPSIVPEHFNPKTTPVAHIPPSPPASHPSSSTPSATTPPPVPVIPPAPQPQPQMEQAPLLKNFPPIPPAPPVAKSSASRQSQVKSKQGIAAQTNVQNQGVAYLAITAVILSLIAALALAAAYLKIF
ncbi:MAG: hypothetical protein ACOY3I_01005 [Verrucomicrobiota bacterium]